MRDIELRLALVCYGGSSLAVYMNGLTAEFLSVVRASTSLESPAMLNPDRPLSPSGILYKELLERLSPKRRVRVVIDIIAGSSAGGLNGIWLARALAHDLSLRPLRDMWLQLGDIEKLMEGYSLAGRFSKRFLQPGIWLLERSIQGYDQFDPEMKRKLNRFFRSRWLKPPFSGGTMLRWMVDAGYGQGDAKQLSSAIRRPYSLMPTGHQLDLFVSVTNFYGELRNITLDNPKVIQERAHGKSLHFRYRRRLSGDGYSDFHDDNVPGLGFTARATSSYPGAFPPVSLRDLDRHLARIGRKWRHRTDFLAHNFSDQLARDNGLSDLRDMFFLDGGIINNKPFSDAIRVLVRRPAQRPVDRRVIFIDPSPSDESDPPPKKIPSFFNTILGGAVNIPLSQPIYEDLRRIEQHNEACRREAALVGAVKNDVADLVADLVDVNESAPITAETLRAGRTQGADLAYNRSGFAVAAYHHARLTDVFQQLTSLVAGLLNKADCPVDRSEINQLIFDWAGSFGLISSQSLGLDAGTRLQTLLDFLTDIDISYRLRRVKRVLAALNELGETGALEDKEFARVKRRLYLTLEQCQLRLDPNYYPANFLCGPPSGKLSLPFIQEAVLHIQGFIKLKALDQDIDRYLSAVISKIQIPSARNSLFRAYVGFAFEDMMTLSLKSDSSGDERQIVKINRISPIDSGWMTDNRNPLMGRNLFNFGAFFSRRARENDYLWGRLQGADRLVDLIISAAGKDAIPEDLDITAFKKKLFSCILKEERDEMHQITDVLEELRLRFNT